MQGTIGHSCSLNGCSSVAVERLGGVEVAASPCGGSTVNTKRLGDMEVSAPLHGCGIAAGATRIGGSEVRASLVCFVNQGKWEYLEVREGELLLIDGQHVLVKRKI